MSTPYNPVVNDATGNSESVAPLTTMLVPVAVNSIARHKCVTDNDIQINIPLGTSVTNGSITGTVIEHYPETAECLVQTAPNVDAILPIEALTVNSRN